MKGTLLIRLFSLVIGFFLLSGPSQFVAAQCSMYALETLVNDTDCSFYLTFDDCDEQSFQATWGLCCRNTSTSITVDAGRVRYDGIWYTLPAPGGNVAIASSSTCSAIIMSLSSDGTTLSFH